MAVVQSIAFQTLSQASSLEEGASEFAARLVNLAKAHDVLTRESWTGADLSNIVEDTVNTHAGEKSRFRIEGPPVRLRPSAALAVAMALHELSTNAAKYGALSSATGRVDVAWVVEGNGEGRRLTLRWTERDGPPVVRPARRGFGSRLIERALAQELGGEVHIAYDPSGVICTIEAPMPDGSERVEELNDQLSRPVVFERR